MADSASPDGGVDGATADATAPDSGPDAMDGGEVCTVTESDAVGPFFEDGSPVRTSIAGPSEAGTRVFITGSLVGVGACPPLAGYIVDIWQADAEGDYFSGADTDYRLRGRVVTAADGTFAFESIKPGSYITPGGPRPSHLHAKVYAPDGGERLTTQVYFVGDPFQGVDDGCGPPTCFSGDPARHIALSEARVGGTDGLTGPLRLVVPA